MEKYIALAQHLDLKVLEFNDQFYIGGTLEDFNEFSGSNYESSEEIATDNEPFLRWISENMTLLEEAFTNFYGVNFEYNDEEYLVVTDEEADNLWEEDLDNYIDECIYPQFEAIGLSIRYFDEEAWKSDARYDGRANSLSCYDGREDSETVEGTTYFIYRVN